MVSGTALFLGLFNNLAIFIVLVAYYGVLIRYLDKATSLVRQSIVGISFGLFAIGCMHAKIPVAVGVIVDQRNTIVALSGAFGGPWSALLSALIAGSYRIYLGGLGVFGGTIGIGLSALAGTVLYKLRGKIDSVFKASFCSLAATIIILPGFLFLGDMQAGWRLLKAMALPYGSAVFIGLFFVGLLLAHQENNQRAQVELRKSEKRYRESEERLDLALSGANEGIWDWNLENGRVHFDSRYYTISGYSPFEFPGAFEEWEKRVHPDDIRQAKSAIQRYLSGDTENFDVEFRFLHKDGHYMWIQGRGKIVHRTERGEPLRFIGTHADITQRKNAEDSLRLSRFIFDKASIGILRIASNAQIVDANRKAAANLGYSVDELRGMSVFDIDAHVRSDEWRAIWKSLRSRGSSYHERVQRRKDGSEIQVEITANLLEYEGKKFSVAFIQDITERKVWENDLKASERRYQDLFNEAPVGYVVTDNHAAEPYIKDVNNTFLQLIGYSRQEVLNTPLSRYYTEASKERMLSAAYPCVLNGVVVREERDLLTRGDKIINTLLHVQPIYLDSNQVAGTLAMFLDITDRKQAEREAKRLESALIHAQKMEAIGTLAGGIAHDFNNILGAIIGYTQLAQINSEGNPDVQEYANQIFIASERAKKLIQQILAFSRQSNLENELVDLGVIIDETLKLIRASIPSTIEIIQNLKARTAKVMANQTQLHQIVLNLCTNASHAMGENGGRLVVDLQPLRFGARDCLNFNDLKPGLYLQLTVSDTGHGMDDYTIARIFEPYFTTKEVGEGTGMGLALVHGIVKNLGGDIKVYSEPGVGTTFHVLLPAFEGRAETTTSNMDSLPKGKGRILFVDDEESLADSGTGLLEFLGYQVQAHTSPNDALEAFRAEPDKFDLVISDMTMPNMYGDKLAEEVKRIRPDMPVIICTGFSKRLSPERVKDMGINGILMKPITLANLSAAVEKVLEAANQSAGS